MTIAHSSRRLRWANKKEKVGVYSKEVRDLGEYYLITQLINCVIKLINLIYLKVGADPGISVKGGPTFKKWQIK